MDLDGKLALVTGGTGTFGGRLAARLVKEGLRVRGLVRNPERASVLRDAGVEIIQGDLAQPATLAAAVKGVSLVVHSAAYRGPNLETARVANIEGTANMADAALAEGVERFLHISTISVYDTTGRDEVDESCPMWQEHEHTYLFTKAEAERRLLERMERGLKATVLRPGAIISEHNSHWGDRLIRRLAEGRFPQTWHPNDLLPWVHTENFADMVLLAARSDAAVGETYTAVDGNVSWGEYQARLAAVFRSLPEPAAEPSERAIFRNDKIRQLGYRTRIGWDETIQGLLRYAMELAADNPSREAPTA